MNNFERKYYEILEEARIVSLNELNPKDFAKSNNNFSENKDIDITNEFDDSLTVYIHKIILLSHCIKSTTENEIHGINYMNISKDRFIEVVSACLRQIIDKHPIFSEQDVTFFVNDIRLKQEYVIVITFKPLEIQDEYNVLLKTVYYCKFRDKEKETIRFSDKGWWKRTYNIPMIVETNQALSFHLTVL